MAEKVSRSNPSGTKIAIDAATLDQVKAGKVVIELSDGSDAVLGTVEQIISGLVEESVANLLRQKTLDLIYEGNETWATATGNDDISVIRGVVNLTIVQAITDWAASYTIPSGTETSGEIVARIPEGANPNDYRIVAGSEIQNVGDSVYQPAYLSSDTTYDYYVIPISFLGNYAVGETLTLQHHGEDGHTSYVGSVPALETVLIDINAALGGKQDKVAFDFDFGKHSFTRPIYPQKFDIHFKNIDRTLLPDGTTQIRIIMRGGTIHTAPVPTEENTVIEAEISATESANITNNLGSRTTLDVQFLYLNAANTTVGRSPIYLIPITDSTTKWNRHEILEFDTSRNDTINAVLPESYINWNFLMVVAEQGNVETHIAIPIEVLTAASTLSNFGTGNRTISWDRATRTITPKQGSNSSIVHCMLI